MTSPVTMQSALGSGSDVFSDVVLRKAGQAKTLADMCCKVIESSSKFPFDSTLVFSHLLVVAHRSNDMRRYFAYELTAAPTSLFKDHGKHQAQAAG